MQSTNDDEGEFLLVKSTFKNYKKYRKWYKDGNIKNFRGWAIAGDVNNCTIKYLFRAFSKQSSVRLGIVKKRLRWYWTTKIEVVKSN